jgi:chromosome partitioning protein
LPTGLALDDLEPSVLLAHELVKKGVSKNKLAFALCRIGDSKTEATEARNYVAEAGYNVLKGALPEKIAYRRASDEGRTLTETRFSSLNKKSDQLAQSIISLATKLHKKRAA